MTPHPETPRSNPIALFRLVVPLLTAVWAPELAAQPASFILPAGPVRMEATRLNALAAPNGVHTVGWFEWSAGSGPNQTTPIVDLGSGSNVVSAYAWITNMDAGKAVRYRFVASNHVAVARSLDAAASTASRPFSWGPNATCVNIFSNVSAAVAISAGKNHALVVRPDGTVAGWGNDAFGKATPPADLTNVVAVAAGGSHSAVLRDDGTVLQWGESGAVPPDLTNVIQIAAGTAYTVALRADGTVAAWGFVAGTHTNTPAALSNVVSVAAGGSHILALRSDGRVVAWGLNTSGQTNVPATATNVVAIAAGFATSFAVREDGTVVAWGSTVNGLRSLPPGLQNVATVAAHTAHAAALTRGGSMIVWSGQSGLSVNSAMPGKLHAIAAGENFTLALVQPSPFAFTQPAQPVTGATATLNGVVTANGLPTTAWFVWGVSNRFDHVSELIDAGDSFGIRRVSLDLADLEAGEVYRSRLVCSNAAGVTTGLENRFTTGRRVSTWNKPMWGSVVPPAGLPPMVRIAGADYHLLALDGEGKLWAWGQYLIGPPLSVPAGLANVVAMAGGRDHSAAVRSDGTVLAWGANYLGQTNVPSAATNVVAVAAGDDQNVALKADGTVICWGGIGAVPAGVSNIVAIAAGDNHNVALRSDGVPFSWDGSSHTQPALREVVGIDAGLLHNLYLREDGIVWEFRRDSLSPGPGVPVPVVSNVVMVAAGDYHNVALDAQDRLHVWGRLVIGVLNTGSTLNGIAALDCGDEFWAALGLNVPPEAMPKRFTGPMNQDVLLRLGSAAPAFWTDPNGDPIAQIRITQLPAHGSLFQSVDGERGEAIATNGALVTDPAGEIIYVPTQDGFGAPYDTFTSIASDGELESLPGLATIFILPEPQVNLSVGAGGSGVTTSAVVRFGGLSNAIYSVWASTNLIDWTRLGTATQPEPNQFSFDDATATSVPLQFYRVLAQ